MQYLVVTHDAPMQEVFRRVLAEMNATVEFAVTPLRAAPRWKSGASTW